MNHNPSRPFGTMPDGTPVDLITLTRGNLSCELITYGGAVRTLTVPDRDGHPVDVVLGFDTLEDYRAQDKYMGAIVGRYANRIADASFTLNGREYPLAANDGANHLHGGLSGFNSYVWKAESLSPDQVSFSRVSPDGEEGYPGTLTVEVTYTLTDDSLEIDYHAVCDQDTICCLTNHSYFNLSGHSSGSVMEQYIQLKAASYTPTFPGSIPTGQIMPVEGTPMDLRQGHRIGEHVDDDFPQLLMAGGYDHNWVIDGTAGTLRQAASAWSEETGIAMEVLTTMPGVQLYTANFLEGCPVGKNGAVYGNRSAFCLETQYYPDSPHHANFPDCVLRAGEAYHHKTIYRFGIK